MVRTAGAQKTMRQVGDEIGAPAATVSQVEKGQRALKEPRIAMWAGALEVSEADLHELWHLSQGLIPLGGGRTVFYADGLGDEPIRNGAAPVVSDGPDLEPIYRLADRIAAVLRRLLPDAGIAVTPQEFEPPYVDEMYAGTITASQQTENEAAADAFLPLPLIEFAWSPTPGRREPSDPRWDAVRVPLLEKLTPIVRRRGSSVTAVDLEDLIRNLSGSERERVRGYIEAIIEQRT